MSDHLDRLRMSAPETEAGRALLDHFSDVNSDEYAYLLAMVAAVETQALAEAIRRVEGLQGVRPYSDDLYVKLNDVRAAILRDLASRDTGATTGGEG